MSFILLSLTVNYASFMPKAHLLLNSSIKSILIIDIEWENPTAHTTCSYIDSSGKTSGPIRRCLFIDYISITFFSCSVVKRSPVQPCNSIGLFC